MRETEASQAAMTRTRSRGIGGQSFKVDFWFSVHPFPNLPSAGGLLFAPRKRLCLEQVNAFLLSSAKPINLPDGEVEREDSGLGNQTEPS